MKYISSQLNIIQFIYYTIAASCNILDSYRVP